MPTFFLIISYYFFYCNNSTNFESVFCMKTVSKKYLKRRRLRARFCLSLGWLHISEEKAIENCDSVDAGAQNVGKVASFWPDVDPKFTVIWRD